MLNLVDGRPAEAVAREAQRRYGRPVGPEDAEALFAFLRANNLVAADEAQMQSFRSGRLRKPGLLSRAAKGYIFFRVPLLRPDAFLQRTLPYVAWLGGRPALLLIALMGLAGFYLAARQIDVFLATLVGFVSLEGLAAYAAVIVAVKAAHEFGHAYAAKLRGLRVPTIGVAFIVFWPIAYTDTTDAWKLTRRRDRLKVGAAGVGVELGIACVSLFLWNVFPDGPLRDALFLLATSTWALSLLINLNPLMRFDGYFLFSDLLRMPNLEPRAHAMGKWRLRRALFGLTDPRPEVGHGWLAGYAYAIWVYRFFLFLGIALLVYFLFFKALGILLFVLEIVYFIAAPVWREVRQWGKRMGEIVGNFAFWRTLALLGLFVAVLAVPWRDTVHAPAVLSGDYRTVYAPEPARLVDLAIAPGAAVDAGTTLARFAAPNLEHELAQAVRKHDELIWERSALGVDAMRRERALVIAAELASQRRLIAALEQRLAKLTVTADRAGVIADMPPDLRTGAWIADGHPLFALRAPDGAAEAVAYVGESEVGRLQTGAAARFVPEPGIWPTVPARVVGIAPSGLERIDEPLATSSHGGGVDVRIDDAGAAIPIRAVYEVRLALEPPPGARLPHELRGRVAVEAAPESLLHGLWVRTLALLRRESGF
jgi:putative peptide zinc metalloprotease protein